METRFLTVLGFSEATLTMIMDVLHENDLHPDIQVINNLGIAPKKPYKNYRFNVNVITELPDYHVVMLGCAGVQAKRSIRDAFNHIPTEHFCSLISKSCGVSNTVDIGKGVFINPMCYIAGHTSISDFVFINRGVSIGHHTYIGKFTTINPGVNIAGNVVIGKNCQIGMGSTIIDGISIGDDCIIGAGSLVTKDVPSGVVAYGSPCKIIRTNG